MNVSELLELAVLDAFGLLEEDEQHAFHRAFLAAPPAVQAQLRREQTRFSHVEDLLPRIEPPATLRAAVLERIRAAEVEPSIRFARRRQVSPWWRAGALGSIAAAIVFGFTTLESMNRYNELQDVLATDQEIAAWVQAVGPDRLQDVLFDPNTTKVSFSTLDPDVEGAASLWDNPDWNTPRLVFKLPKGVELEAGYRLAIVDDDQNVIEVLGSIDGGTLEYRDLDARPSGRLAICDQEGRRTLLLADSAL